MNRLIDSLLKFFKEEKIFCIIVISVMFFTRIIYCIYNYSFKYKTDNDSRKMYLKVIEKQKIEVEKVSYLVEYDKNNFIMNIYFSENSGEYEYCNGDILVIIGKIIIPETLGNPYEFNYKRYLNSINIVGTISVSSVKKIGKEKAFNFNMLDILKENLLKKEEFLNTDEKSLFNSMILGIKDYNGTLVQEYFKESGSSHFLAISGTHITYYMYVIAIFTKNYSKRIRTFINIVAIILFNIMIGFQISLVRASIMYIINIFDIKNINKYLKLLITALLIILYNPYVIFNVSFIFSFLSVSGIALFSSSIVSYFDIILMKFFKLKYINEEFFKFSKIKKVTYYIFKYLLKSTSFVLSVQLMTLPFYMYYFCEVNFIAILSNIVLTPIITFELVIGFLSFLLSYIPFVSDIFILSNKPMLSIIILISKTLSNFSALKFSVIKPDVISIILYYTIIFLIIFKKYLYKYFNKTLVKKLKKIVSIVTFLGILYIISMYIKVLFFEEYVYFFNVGQGNMALIHKFNTNVVVDLGSTSKGVASNILLDFLRAKNISKIDMIIITHMHEDHMNGVEEVIEHVEVSKVIFSNFEDKDKNENSEFERKIKEKQISVINLNKGDNVIFKGIEIDVLSPPSEKVIYSSDIINSNSLVFIVSKGNDNYLFLGDATKETEEYMFKNVIYDDRIYVKLMNLKVVQVGHHGSKTSTSKLLMKNINPCVAVISSKKKKFGHPDEETINILEEYKFNVKITELKGAIKIK